MLIFPLPQHMSHIDFIKKIIESKNEHTFRLAQVGGDGRLQHMEKEFSYCIIGRNPDCNIIPKQGKPSRYHCVIYFTDETLNVRDLDSKVGTFFGVSTEANSKLRIPPFTQQCLTRGNIVVVEGEQLVVTDISIKHPLESELLVQKEHCNFCGNEI